jgi:hypothetical protein
LLQNLRRKLHDFFTVPTRPRRRGNQVFRRGKNAWRWHFRYATAATFRAPRLGRTRAVPGQRCCTGPPAAPAMSIHNQHVGVIGQVNTPTNTPCPP